MSTLTREAQERLDRYLGDVRSSLRGCRSVDPKEVEADVTEHINGELEGLTEPVPLADLEAVSAEHSSDPTFHRVLGDAYMRSGKLAEALELYRDALEDL